MTDLKQDIENIEYQKTPIYLVDDQISLIPTWFSMYPNEFTPPPTPLTPPLQITPLTRPLTPPLTPSDSEDKTSQQISLLNANFFDTRPLCDHCIIIDWDDTLLPTTHLTKIFPINDNRTSISTGLSTGLHAVTPTVSQTGLPTENLQKLEETLVTFFNQIRHIGDVFIITNSQKGWVELSCRQYIPNAWNWLKHIPIISERSEHEKSHPNNPFMWKYTAFQKCIQEHHKCLISFGCLLYTSPSPRDS